MLLEFSFTGFVLIECANGDEGLREIMRCPPDLLITDYSHPGCRGDEMFERLRQCPAKFPIVVASAFVRDNPDLQNHILSFPGLAMTLLNKPFNIEELKVLIIQCLELAE